MKAHLSANSRISKLHIQISSVHMCVVPGHASQDVVIKSVCFVRFTVYLPAPSPNHRDCTIPNCSLPRHRDCTIPTCSLPPAIDSHNICLLLPPAIETKQYLLAPFPRHGEPHNICLLPPHAIESHNTNLLPPPP
jgi:hypothetical protein